MSKKKSKGMKASKTMRQGVVARKVNSTTGDKEKLRQKDMAKTVYTINYAKAIAMYTLRNAGWGNKRLTEFSKKFNEHLADMTHDRFNIEDILGVLEDEAKIKHDDIRI